MINLEESYYNQYLNTNPFTAFHPATRSPSCPMGDYADFQWFKFKSGGSGREKNSEVINEPCSLAAHYSFFIFFPHWLSTMPFAVYLDDETDSVLDFSVETREGLSYLAPIIIDDEEVDDLIGRTYDLPIDVDA